jgi:hypothetical protein
LVERLSSAWILVDMIPAISTDRDVRLLDVFFVLSLILLVISVWEKRRQK